MAGDDTFVQEACLGRVKMLRGKKVCYLIKWAGWDAVKDITCEPPNNVLVDKVEEPLLDQGADGFKAQLQQLLAHYLEGRASRPSPPAPASPLTDETQGSSEVKEEAQGRSRKKKAEESADKQPNKKAKSRTSGQTQYCVDAPDPAPPEGAGAEDDAHTTGSTYSVKHRQYILVPETSVCRDGALAAVFLKVGRAKLNPGVGWTIQSNLRCAGAHPDHEFLGGSVDGLSSHVGFGWFHHPTSGLSLQGRRQVDHSKYNCLRFAQGDTIGIVVDLGRSVGYCVRNGSTVFRVEFTSCTSQPMVFAIHLCGEDQVTLCSPPKALETYVDDSVPQVLAPDAPTPR